MRIQATAVTILTTLALTTAGCDKLTSTTSAVSIITDTPAIEQSTGWNDALSSILPPESIPMATVAMVGVAQRDSITSTATPKPVTGATVSLSYADAAGTSQTVSLCEGAQSAAGTYETSSLAGTPCASALGYVAGSTYKTTIETAKDTYTLSVKAPNPLAASAVSFTPALADANVPAQLSPMYEHGLNDALTVSWTLPAADQGKNVFLTVARINFNSAADMSRVQDATNPSNWTVESKFPVWTNVPQTPNDMMDVVTGTPQTSAEIPATAFSQQGLYLLVVTVAELSDQTTGLSIASGALAGAPTGFIFVVQ